MNLTKFALLGAVLFGTAHAMLPTLNPLVPTASTLVQPLQAQSQFQPVQPLNVQPLQTQVQSQWQSLQTQAQSQLSPLQPLNVQPVQAQPQQVQWQTQPQTLPQSTPLTTFTPPPVQESISTTLHAYVLEGDTLAPVTPQTVLQAGDVVEYHAYVANHSKERVRSVNVSFDVPKEAELIGGFSPDTPLASVDGTRFYPTPLRTNVGGQVETIAMSRYKAIRWNVQDLGIDGVAVVKFQMKLK